MDSELSEESRPEKRKSKTLDRTSAAGIIQYEGGEARESLKVEFFMKRQRKSSVLKIKEMAVMTSGLTTGEKNKQEKYVLIFRLHAGIRECLDRKILGISMDEEAIIRRSEVVYFGRRKDTAACACRVPSMAARDRE